MGSVNDQAFERILYLSMGGVHPAAENALRNRNESRTGLHGVKLHPEYQEFELLDKGWMASGHVA